METSVYVLRNPEDRVYVGTTMRPLMFRIAQHNGGRLGGGRDGAAYTREHRKPWQHVHTATCETAEQARALEAEWIATLHKTGTLPFLDFTPTDWGPQTHPGLPGTRNPRRPPAPPKEPDAPADELAPEPWDHNDPDTPEYTHLTETDAFPGAWKLTVFDPFKRQVFYVGTFAHKADAIATAYTWQNVGGAYALADQWADATTRTSQPKGRAEGEVQCTTAEPISTDDAK